ncbi:MAG TPA: glycoside hydrolase family 66 protein [Candidatus Sulfomarinibacteraceae bacterium]|nr:glycoside hydrolase family 66 protein [Candidatus Sulfomarinibacteraceae bacterium]
MLSLYISFDCAIYHPGQPVTLTVQLSSQVPQDTPAHLRTTLRHLNRDVDDVTQPVTLTGGDQTLSLTLTPPPTAPRGYGLDLALETADGRALARHTTAFDVLNHWTEAPRYGFLSDFAPGRDDAPATMRTLARYHINALQFYDWMYRHEQLLPEEEPYLDPLDRRLSLDTVKALIDAAHAENMAAMPYAAVYAASIPFYEEHPEWALYEANGDVHYFGENFLVYMDPRPGSPWTRHLLGQFEDVLSHTDFDGIHLDQYGAPKVAYDAQGQRFDLAQPLAHLIDATQEVVQGQRDDGAVVFNAVTNWPIEAVAPAAQDIVYIEVWDPYVGFEDLHTLIVQAQALGQGKPVVLAAYIDPAWEHNVRLMDAIIFASGGGHIELGEQAALLADPYFPKHRPMSPALAEAVRGLYDFAVRYQDVIGPRTQNATPAYARRITVDGASSNPSQRKNKVWPIVRERDDFTAISLINLRDVGQVRWDQEVPAAPARLGPTTVRLAQVEREVAAVWLATPDGNDIAPQPLAHEFQNATLTFTMPSLAYWNLIIIEWAAD